MGLPERNEKGQWKKGVSGNPRGGAVVVPPIVRLARMMSPQMMRVVYELALDEKVTPRVRAACAIAIVDRAHGRPRQMEKHEQPGRPTGPIELIVVDGGNRDAITAEPDELDLDEAGAAEVALERQGLTPEEGHGLQCESVAKELGLHDWTEPQ